MKRMILLILLVVAVVAICYGAERPLPNRSRNLRDFIYQTPSNIYGEFGFSEETELLYNLVTLKEKGQTYEVRIKALEAQVAKLTESQKITDPNGNR